jgi:putative phosphoesterase
MRAAVISDTHMPRGGRRLPQACLDHLYGADVVLHAGDVTGTVFLDELERLGRPVHAVYGNADEWAVRDRLPERLVVELETSRIGLVHDPGPLRGREDRLTGWFPTCDAVVFGHTHRPQVERHRRVWLLNPGSPTERRRSPTRSMLLVELGRSGVRPELIELAP